MPLLEVIATSAQDAAAAVRGGADRLEVVEGMEHGGLTPSPRTVAAIRASLPDVPLRVMLRSNGMFDVTPAEVDELARRSRELRDVGATAFVFGFITTGGEIDTASTGALADIVAPLPWTFHHAFDRVHDAADAWRVLRTMTGVDLVLTAGSAGNLTTGLDVACARGPWQSDRLRFLAGGGLRERHVPVLRRARITQFHVGSGARINGAWTSPVEARAVRRWRVAVDGSNHVDDPSGT